MNRITVPAEENAIAVFISYSDVQEYECELFGLGRNGIIVRPKKKDIPNFFWRWMQYLILGNKWKRIKC